MAASGKASRAIALLVGLFNRTRYLHVGALCAACNNALVIGASCFGLHYSIALIAGFVCVTTLAYVLHTLYTFGTTLSAVGLRRYFIGNLGGLLLSEALMVLFCEGLGLSTRLAMPIVTVLLLGWNFMSARWAVSARPRPAPLPTA